MRSIHELSDLFATLPGIGPRQARRIVQYLLAREPRFREQLADTLKDIGAHVSQCTSCFRFDEASNLKLCRLCRDEARDPKTVMVVEKDVDIDGIESSEAYRGLYFVLGGLMSMGREKKNAPKPRTKELVSRIKKNGVEEVIFALSTTPEGDYTARELAREIKTGHPNIRASLLGRGLSVGAEIEYADQETIRSALKNRS